MSYTEVTQRSEDMAEYSNAGVVREVSAKPFTDRKTGDEITLHSFRIEGSNRWFRTGQKKPPFAEGQFVKFTNDEKANVKVESVEVTDAPAQAEDTAPTATSGQGATSKQTSRSSGAQTRDGYWSQKEQRDIERDTRYQTVDIPRMTFSAAQDRAVQLVAAALENDVLSFGNAKKGDRFDMLMDYVDQATDRFLLQSMNAHNHYRQLVEGYPEAPQEVHQPGPSVSNFDEE